MEAEDYLLKLGSKIKEIRLSKSMRQIDLADKIGIEDSALRRIESGRVNSTIIMLRKIADGLNIDVKDLIDIN